MADDLKLGKKPARPDAISFKFATYFDASALPTPPKRFGHHGLIRDWLTLANDKVGDCVIAGGCHETMMWHAESSKSPALFDDATAIRNYSEITGYDPNDPNSDQGTDMEMAARFRRKTGLIDVRGERHTIDCYVAPRKGDVDALMLATYLFGATGIGIEFPDTAMQQFRAGQVWDIAARARIEGGHYVPVVGRNSAGNILCVTWGRLQAMTPRFYRKYCDEAIAYVSTDPLNNKLLSPEGYHLDALRADLAALKK